MFSKSKPMPASESVPSLPPAVPAKMATGARHTTFSILGSDVVVTGNVAASVDLHVDGKIEGDLKCANLVQGEASEIKGAVTAETAKIARSEERRVGKECVRTCKSRWETYH